MIALDTMPRSVLDHDWEAAAAIYRERFMKAGNLEEASEALQSGLIAEAMAAMRPVEQ